MSVWNGFAVSLREGVGITSKIVVTGASSFIGVYLVENLLARGDEVVAVLRPKSDAAARFSGRFGKYLRIVHADMSGYDILAESIHDSDFFVHLAWNGTRGGERQEQGRQEENYRCSIHALQSAMKMGARAFISAGSQAEYGQQSGVVNEAMPSMPFSQYGKYKWRFYREAEPLCRQAGMKLYEPRFFSLYGKGDFPETLVNSTVAKMLRDEECAFTDCRQMWNFLHVRDAVAGMLHLLDTDAPAGIYNFGSRDTRRLRGYIEEMAELTQTKSVMRFGVIPHNDSGREGIQPDIGKLLSTGWEPKITFAEGVREIIQAVCHER